MNDLVSIDGTPNTYVGVLIAKKPNIPAPKHIMKSVTIPGKGTIYTTTDEVEDIPIKLECNYIMPSDFWQAEWRSIRKWANKPNKALQFGEDLEVYYKIKMVDLSECERVSERIGKFDATFTCDGYEYLERGKYTYGVDEVLYNHYAKCAPKYLITGEGMCTLTVNGKEVTANIGQNLTIDTDLKLCYRLDGTQNNTSMSGYYEDLYLNEGQNAITISNGFDLKIVPNWRCD